ncbi:MAG: DUF697 domain-containing protein [Myxococcaceae bacterium]
MSWMDSLNAAARGAGRKLDPDDRERIATDVVMMSATGTAVLTLAPIPLTDFVVVTPVQAAMVLAVGRVYGRELDFDESKHLLWELASVCGVSLVAQKGFATLTKLLLPGLGGVLSGPYAFAVTYAMGTVSMRYFEDKKGSRELLGQVYKDAFKVGRKLFSREKVEQVRKKHGKDIRDYARTKK